MNKGKTSFWHKRVLKWTLPRTHWQKEENLILQKVVIRLILVEENDVIKL